jgi:hypothetical protein
MGIMKRILENNKYNSRASSGFSFTNEDPEVVLQRAGVFSGVTGQHMLQHKITIPKFNEDVKVWGDKTAENLRNEVDSVTSKGKQKSPRVYKKGIHQGKREGKLRDSIRAKYRIEKGGAQIESIGFNLERHGVFLQKGVGAGYKASGASVARTAKKEDAEPFRFRKNWFNNVLDRNISELSEIVVHHAGDAIVLNTKRMFIQ